MYDPECVRLLGVYFCFHFSEPSKCRAGKSITPIGQSKPHASSGLKAHRLIFVIKKRARSPRKKKRDRRGAQLTKFL